MNRYVFPKPAGLFLWLLVSEPGFLMFVCDLGRKFKYIYIYIEIEAQEQYSLIDTIFNYIFDFGPPGKYL